MRIDKPIALSVLLCIAGCGDEAEEFHALGTLERDRIDLAADSDEPIVRIAVREGQAIAPGDLLIVQDSARAEAALHRAWAEVEAAKAALAEAEEGPRAQQIAQARARLQATKSARETPRLELDRQMRPSRPTSRSLSMIGLGLNYVAEIDLTANDAHELPVGVLVQVRFLDLKK